jgi:hypothetical protein
MGIEFASGLCFCAVVGTYDWMPKLMPNKPMAPTYLPHIPTTGMIAYPDYQNHIEVQRPHSLYWYDLGSRCAVQSDAVAAVKIAAYNGWP